MADSHSSSEDEAAIVAYIHIHNQKRRRSPRWWVKPWLERREEFGAYDNLFRELREENPENFTNFLRMEPHHFDILVERTSRFLPDRKDTIMRKCIAKEQRIQVTLRFLAAGGTYEDIGLLYRISRQSMGKIVPETCRAIYEALKADYMKIPGSTQDWEKIAADFEDKWHFPNCIGALDGKHIALKAPSNSGSQFFNYKKFHSIVLMALVDAQKRFIWFDIGANGRNNDAGVFAHSGLATALQNQTLRIPPPKAPEGWHTPLPYVIVGDEAFPLKTYIMKPYPSKGLSADERVYNYRLSRARNTVENAFGILVNRFAVLSTKMHVNPDVATDIVMACLALHNFLRTECDELYNESVKHQIAWHDELGRQGSNNSATSAQQVRNDFRDYFTSVGAVPWQWDKDIPQHNQ